MELGIRNAFETKLKSDETRRMCSIRVDTRNYLDIINFHIGVLRKDVFFYKADSYVRLLVWYVGSE